MIMYNSVVQILCPFVSKNNSFIVYDFKSIYPVEYILVAYRYNEVYCSAVRISFMLFWLFEKEEKNSADVFS